MKAFFDDSGTMLTVALADGSFEQFTIDEFISIYGADALPQRGEALPVLEYLGEFKALIDACGKVSYYFNMKKYVAADVNKAKIVASAYQHDLKYYEDQLNEWRVKAERSYNILKMHADKFDYKMPARKEFLNGLTVSEDRRSAYKGYLATCLKNRKTLSPAALEKKFQNLLKKRLIKKA